MSYELWDRDALYEEVWETPMAKLAKKYSISDVGLAKVCRKLEIPLPGRGYWAKKEAGHKLKKMPLPPQNAKVVLYKPTPSPEPPRLSNDATQAEMAQVEQLEATTGETTLKRGSLSHPLIIQARTVLGRAQVDDRKILRTTESCLDVRVAKERLDRALRIMAGLISIVEDAGFSISVLTRDREHQTVASIYGEQIRFGLVEKVDRVEISAPPKGGLLERVLTFAGKPVTLEPSGRLSIRVLSAYGSDRKKWADGKAQLEPQLPKIAGGLIRLALADRSERKRRAAEEQERQRIAQEQARLESLIKTEKSRVRALRHAAAGWSRAEQIRSFISAARAAAINEGQSVEVGSVFGDWIVWAEQQADRMDPLKESPSSIIDHLIETQPTYPSYYGYGYRKPDPPFRFPKPIWRMK